MVVILMVCEIAPMYGNFENGTKFLFTCVIMYIKINLGKVLSDLNFYSFIMIHRYNVAYLKIKCLLNYCVRLQD